MQFTLKRVCFQPYDFENVADIERLKNFDAWALNDIKAAEELISAAKDYRLKLAARVQELMTMESHTRVTLKRERRYSGHVYFFLTTEKVYPDGSAAVVERTTYEGKDRHTAIRAFRKMKEQFPKYEFVEDISKGKWER